MAFWAPIIAAVAGSAMGGMMGRSNAKQQQDAQNKAYQQRYQWTMNDLEKAGLNPMLAMNQGAVSGAGQMAMAQTPDVGGALTSGVKAGTEAVLAKASAKNLEAQTAAGHATAHAQYMQANKNQADAVLSMNNAIGVNLENERSSMENEALRKNPDAIYHQKYQGQYAREIQHLGGLVGNSAKAVGRFFKADWQRQKDAAEAQAVENHRKRNQ